MRVSKDIYIVEYFKNAAEYYLRKFYDQFNEFVVRKYKYRLELVNGYTITAVGFHGSTQEEDLYFLSKHDYKKFRGEDLLERAYQDHIKYLKAQIEKLEYEIEFGESEDPFIKGTENFRDFVTDIFNNRYKRQVEKEHKEGIPIDEKLL